MGAKAIPALKVATGKTDCHTHSCLIVPHHPYNPIPWARFCGPREEMHNFLLRTRPEYADGLLEEVRPSIISSSANPSG